MKFRAVITEEYTEITGKTNEILAGLVMYVRALRKQNISEKVIREVIDLALKNREEKRAETILDNEKVKIQKFDLNSMSKEEAKDLIEKEIFKMFD